MTTYKPRRYRPWLLPSILARAIGHLLRHWLLFLIIFLAVSPVGPHVLVESYYTVHGTHRNYIGCKYFGARGIVYHRDGDTCPFITIIDARKRH